MIEKKRCCNSFFFIYSTQFICLVLKLYVEYWIFKNSNLFLFYIGQFICTIYRAIFFHKNYLHQIYLFLWEIVNHLISFIIKSTWFHSYLMFIDLLVHLNHPNKIDFKMCYFFQNRWHAMGNSVTHKWRIHARVHRQLSNFASINGLFVPCHFLQYIRHFVSSLL